MGADIGKHTCQLLLKGDATTYQMPHHHRHLQYLQFDLDYVSTALTKWTVREARHGQPPFERSYDRYVYKTKKELSLVPQRRMRMTLQVHSLVTWCRPFPSVCTYIELTSLFLGLPVGGGAMVERGSM